MLDKPLGDCRILCTRAYYARVGPPKSSFAVHEDANHRRDHRNERMLGWAFWLIAGFMGVEVVGAVVGNSLTLAADAGHMFLDASALGLSWCAMRLSRRAATSRLTYGYHRFQVLAAFVNGLALLALVAWIVYGAAGRLRTPEDILPLPVLGVAITGLVVNLVAYRMLHGTNNLVVRSAALHVLGDLLGSAAAIISALAMLAFGWRWADPLLALVVAGILVRGAWRVLRDAGRILLEASPRGLDIKEMQAALTADVPGVVAIHHVHAWALTSERPMVTLHATVDEAADTQSTVTRIKAVLKATFGIHHSTVQVERGDCPDGERQG